MATVSFAKVLNSKWTACTPQNGEKHFLVTRIADHRERRVKLECVVTRSTQIVRFDDLASGEKFKPGWC